MKNIPQLMSLAIVALGLSSCCSMFGLTNQNGSYRTETRQVKTCGYDVVYEQVVTADGSKGGMVQTVEKRVPRYKTVTKKVWVSGGPCVRYYCPKNDACGTTSSSTILMATTQGATGSPHMGQIPTMKVLAP